MGVSKVNYVVFATVKTVHCKPDGVLRPAGWFVNFEHSHEALFMGHERPSLEPGDQVKITFERLAA